MYTLPDGSADGQCGRQHKTARITFVQRPCRCSERKRAGDTMTISDSKGSRNPHDTESLEGKG